MTSIIQPTLERPHPAAPGTQKIYRFDNGYGASVVQFSWGGLGGSYGAESGRWELAVLRFTNREDFDPNGKNWDLAYDTPITDDVVGHLDDEDVQELLVRIRALPDPDAPVKVASQIVETPALTSAEENAR
jgi:hypothetical protein